MFLSKLFKHTRAKVMLALAGLTMVMGAGAAIGATVSAQQNETVKTKADSVARTIYITNNYSCSNLRVHYWGSSENTISMTNTYRNTSNQDVYRAVLPAGTTGWQFIGYYGSWSRDTYSLDQSVPSNNTTGYYIQDTSGDGGSKFYMKTWTVTTFTVRFNANGGTGSMSNKSCYCNANSGNNLTTNAFSYSGFVFKNWATNADGSGTTYANGAHINNGTSGATVDLYAQWVRESGYYLIGTGLNGSTGNFDISEAIASSGSDASNAAKFENVTMTATAKWKIVWWDSGTAAITHWFNTDFAGQHVNHTWATPHDSKNIVCSVAGTYKVYLSSDADDADKKVSVNMDVTIACYQVRPDGTASFVKNVTGNSDVLLSSTLTSTTPFGSLAGLTISGYYTDSTCTSSVTPGSYYPTAGFSLYAKYMPSFSTIANDKVRIWLTYWESNNGEKYFDSDSAAIKLWIHSTSGGGTEEVYSSYTIYNNQADETRYDYFDVNLSCFTSGWYLSVQRFSSDGKTWWSTADALQLSSTNVGKVFSLKWGGSSWYVSPRTVDSPDTEMAVLALCGLHVCSSSAFNGYNAYSNYNTTFVKDGSGDWKVDDRYYDAFANYYIYDYAQGDKTYAGSINAVANAYDKYVAIGNMSRTTGRTTTNLSRVIPGTADESPLTLTLWIVLGSGVLGLGAIGTAYFVSKKKKRPQA